MVRIPPVLPTLPNYGEAFVLHEPFSTLFDTVADVCNHLAGFQFLRAVPVIVTPFRRTRTGNDVHAETTRAIRFTTSPLARFLFVAAGYSAVHAGGRVKFAARQAHATIPGAGAVIDPGCLFLRANNDLPNPVQDRVYVPTGLQWAHSGFTSPPSVNAGDPVSQRPRMLNVTPSTDVDLCVTWEDIALNAVHVFEAWRPNV